MSTFLTSKVYAQGSTKIVLSTDKSSYNVGDTVRVTVQAHNAVDLFGVQFTFHYDPSMLSMEENDFTFSNGYAVFGGSTVDKKKGVVTYPVINKNPSPDNKSSVTVGYANFKATKEGPVTLNMDNIKSVNTQSVEINYNTQTQSVFNVAKAPSNSDSGSNSSNNSNTNQGNNNNENGNNGHSGENVNQSGNYNSSNANTNSGSSSNNGNISNNKSDSNGGNSGSISNNGGSISNDQVTVASSSSGDPAADGNTASQEQNGNSTNKNSSLNSTTDTTENGSQEGNAGKKTSNIKSNSGLNNILLIVVIAVIIIVAAVAFLNREKLKDIFYKLNRK